MWDEYSRQHFNLKTIIFYTLNGKTARLSLTGQVKEKTGCVICVDQTELIYLPSSTLQETAKSTRVQITYESPLISYVIYESQCKRS
jgi:hypothetical protein